MRGVSCAAAITAMVGLFGCGSGDPFNKQPVGGSVTIKGQPVKIGQIFFEPAAGQQVATNAQIVDGAFKLTKEQGLSPGKYSWKLLVYDRQPNNDAANPGPSGPEPKNIVPAKDNGGTFDVKAGEETKLDISIP